jgi:hypothetical protein
VGLLGTREACSGQPIAKTRAIVDSGADYTLFSAEWAKLLGIDLDLDCITVQPTVALGAPHAGAHELVHYAYADGLWVEILDDRLLLPTVVFCKSLAQTLLGRRDFFHHYLVAFDQRNLRFFLERLPDRHEDEDDDVDPALVTS